MIGKFFHLKNKVSLVSFYAALVTLDKEGPCIFAGYWGNIEDARKHVDKLYPNRWYAAYDKIFLDGTPTVMDIKN